MFLFSKTWPISAFDKTLLWHQNSSSCPLTLTLNDSYFSPRRHSYNICGRYWTRSGSEDKSDRNQLLFS